MLKQRVITAAIALPLALGIFLYGSSDLLLYVFTICVAFGTYEVASMVAPRLEGIFKSGVVDSPVDSESPKWVVLCAVLVACAIFYISARDPEYAGRGMIVAGMLGSILVGSFLANNNELAFARLTTLLLSIIYGSFPWLATWELYNMGPGAKYVMFLIAVVFSGDTGAYFGGKFYGKTKLAPRMSPNKTREGAFFGLLASLCAGSLVNLIYSGTLSSWYGVLAASLFGGAFGQMGDLVESTIKRFCQVKDSGRIFPGHGGFLDRVDGVLFAAPVIWFTFYIFKIG